MANGIDRLEKLFSKKRPASARTPAGHNRTASLQTPSTLSPATAPPQFPQPSFMRPTSTRMVARQDVAHPSSSSFKPAAARAQSLPDASSPPQASKSMSPPLLHHEATSNTSNTSLNPEQHHLLLHLSPPAAAPFHPPPSSLLRRRRHLVAPLANFQFPDKAAQGEGEEEARHTPDVSPTSTSPPPDASSSSWKPHLTLPAQQEPAATTTTTTTTSVETRLDTPPPSDQDEIWLLSAPGAFQKPRPSPSLPPPQPTEPTPAPSPEMPPVRDSTLGERPRSHELAPKTPSLRRNFAAPATPSPTWSLHPSVANSSSSARSSLMSPPYLDPVLKEPDFSDFFSLSDDDIAEAKPPLPTTLTKANQEEPTTTALGHQGQASMMSPASSARNLRACAAPSAPPNFQAPSVPSPGPSTPPPPPPTASLSPLPRELPATPTALTLANPAAMAAAFEVARIASRYHFDLVYVVNLRSKHAAPSWQPDLPPDSPLSPCDSLDPSLQVQSILGSAGSAASMSPPRSKLAGRFLAAYGLSAVKLPFRLPASIHRKILNADCWLEYRDPEAKQNEFARGYGCAFYAGHDADPASRCQQGPPPPFTAADVVVAADDCDADTEADASEGSATPRPRRRGGDAWPKKPSVPRNNRGIAFVAYTKLPLDGGDAASHAAKLDMLHRDAQALVEIILDFHSIQRRREQRDDVRGSNRDQASRPLWSRF